MSNLAGSDYYPNNLAGSERYVTNRSSGYYPRNVAGAERYLNNGSSGYHPINVAGSERYLNNGSSGYYPRNVAGSERYVPASREYSLPTSREYSLPASREYSLPSSREYDLGQLNGFRDTDGIYAGSSTLRPPGASGTGNPLVTSGGATGRFDADYDLGDSRLQYGDGLEFGRGLQFGGGLEFGRGLQFGGGLEFGRGLEFGGGLEFGRGLEFGGGLGDRSGNSGAINRGTSTIRQGKAVGSGGLGAGPAGNSGAINRGSSKITQGKAVGSGGLGARSGNSGAINRGTSAIRQGNAVGSGGLGAKSGSRGANKNPQRRNKTKKAPIYVFRKFGEPVKGHFKLTKLEKFDLKTAKKLPVKIDTWKAILNGSDWTPELGVDYADRYYNELIEQEVNATTRGYSLDPDGTAVPHSDNCEIRYDTPDRTGLELKRETVELAVPNTLESDAWFQDPPTPDYTGPSPSNFHTVKNPQRGTTIWPEPLIILP